MALENLNCTQKNAQRTGILPDLHQLFMTTELCSVVCAGCAGMSGSVPLHVFSFTRSALSSPRTQSHNSGCALQESPAIVPPRASTFQKAQISSEVKRGSLPIEMALPCGFKRLYAFECSIAEPGGFGKGFACLFVLVFRPL